MDVATDDQLLAAAHRDGAAFTGFYLRYERAMLAFFLRRTGDAELAGDLTAEVFAAVLLACRRSGWRRSCSTTTTCGAWRRAPARTRC
jgi:DNA-directed RNA polymerase specialized sigma24 family protein